MVNNVITVAFIGLELTGEGFYTYNICNVFM